MPTHLFVERTLERLTIALLVALALALLCTPARPSAVRALPPPRGPAPPSSRLTGHAEPPPPALPPTLPPALASPPPPPLANLALAWRFATSSEPDHNGPWHLVDASSRYVLLESTRTDSQGTDRLLLDSATGAVVSRVVGYRGTLWNEPSTPRFVDTDCFLAAATLDTFAAIDARTGATRWTATHPTYFTIAAGEPGAATVVLYHSGSGTPPANLVALDTRTGATRFSAHVDLQIDTTPALAGERVFTLLRGPTLVARAADTGAVLWSRALGGSEYTSWLVRASRERVVAVGPERVAVFDAATGTPLQSIPRPTAASLGDAAMDGTAIVVSNSPSGMNSMDLPASRSQWTRALSVYQLTAHADALYGCTTGSVLHAIDRRTGTSAWSLGLASCNTGYPAFLPWFRVAADTPLGDAVVVDERDGEVRAYARMRTPTTPEAALITGVARFRGRPLRGVEVRVGDATVHTDARGRFRAGVEGRGRLSVTITGDEARRATGLPCGRDAHELVALRGVGRYALTIEPDVFPEHECGCGECD